MNYTQLLQKGVKGNMDVSDIPVTIHTIDMQYPLSFIDFEAEDTLGINCTAEDGTERFVILNKKHIVDISVLYEDDIKILTNVDISVENDVMYQ